MRLMPEEERLRLLAIAERIALVRSWVEGMGKAEFLADLKARDAAARLPSRGRCGPWIRPSAPSAGRGHVDQDEADALVLLAGVGAHQAEAPVGPVGVGGPDLLAVDQPVVAGVLAMGGEAGQVRAGSRYGVFAS
jgi:hypothetical protein